MSHLSGSLMNSLNQTEPEVFKLWMLYFQRFPNSDFLEVDVQLYEHSIASFCLVLFKQSKFTKCVSFFLVQDFEWFQCKTCSDKNIYTCESTYPCLFYTLRCKTLLGCIGKLHI